MLQKSLKISSLLFFVILSFSGQAFWKWTKVQALSNGKRFESTSFSINGKGYVTCGIDTNDNCYNDLWEYDPVFNFWTQKANLPANYRRGSFGFELNGKGYLGGGVDDAVTSAGTIFNEFWMYDPILNNWTSKANVPVSLFRAAGVSCNNKGYMIGGSDEFSIYSNIYEYNPLTNSWVAKSIFPGVPTSSGGREGGAATCINNKVYFGFGKDDSFFENDWWEFNPATNIWTRKADFPGTGRTGPFAFTINNMGVAGMGSDGSFNSDTWWYNATADTWNYTCSFTDGGRRSVAAFGIGNVGYMGTGKSSGGSKQDFYRLDADVSVNELAGSSSLFSVYPNPVIAETINMTFEAELINATVSILNIEGKVIRTEPIILKDQKLFRNEIGAGVYFIVIQNKRQLLATKKIILL